MRKMMQWVMAAMLVCGASVMASCANEDDPAGRQDGDPDVPSIILDTDIGSSADDLFALEMLYRYHGQGRCRLLGVVVDREGEDCAACADVMNTYFGHGDTPIGLVRNGIPAPAVWIDYKALPRYTLADGTPMFARSISDYSALPDGWQLYRRLLAAQPDHSVSICTTGFVTALAQLLQSEADEHSPLSGVELVRQKVKCIYIQGGVFGNAVEPDFNFGQGITFAMDFFRLWPKDVDMVLSPGEVGDAIEYTPEQVVGDVSWTDVHPVKQVYLTCNCNTGQKMWDPLTVIQAVEGDAVFSLSQRGTVSLTPQAETLFTPSPTGHCRYQQPGSAEWAAQILEKIRQANRGQGSVPYRELYRNDGTASFYDLIDGQWVEEETTYNEYFADGPLFCFRWQKPGQEGRHENWEIVSCENGKMVNKAFLRHADGTTYTITAHLTRVEKE